MALTANDAHLESYAQVENVHGNPTRFFSGKVAVMKDMKPQSKSPVNVGRSLRTTQVSTNSN